MNRSTRSLSFRRRWRGGTGVDTGMPWPEALDRLVLGLHDDAAAFEVASEHVSSPALRTLFAIRADGCRRAAAELAALGGGLPPEAAMSTLGRLQRLWIAARGTLAGYSNEAMLEACEQVERQALARHDRVLEAGMPPRLRGAVERHRDLVERHRRQLQAWLQVEREGRGHVR